MKLERTRPAIYRLTLHTYELAALIAAARWVAEGGQGDLPKEATEQLASIIAAYDAESVRLNSMNNKS